MKMLSRTTLPNHDLLKVKINCMLNELWEMHFYVAGDYSTWSIAMCAFIFNVYMYAKICMGVVLNLFFMLYNTVVFFF